MLQLLWAANLMNVIIVRLLAFNHKIVCKVLIEFIFLIDTISIDSHLMIALSIVKLVICIPFINLLNFEVFSFYQRISIQ